MKLRTIRDTMNINNSVEYLANLIMSGETRLILDSEIGNIVVSIIDAKFHDPHDSNFGINLYRFDEAPLTNYIYDLMHRPNKDDYRWYLEIPRVKYQSREFTRRMSIRALMMVFLSEIIEDTVNAGTMSTEMVDAACIAYQNEYLHTNAYGYQSFSNELCKLSMAPIHRMSQAYKNFCISNKDMLRIRAYSGTQSLFSGRADRGFEKTDMGFGGRFYADIFFIVLNELRWTFTRTMPAEAYEYLTSKQAKGGVIWPIALMKICLMDKDLPKKDTDKEDQNK